MKKTFKRSLSVLLAAVMLLSFTALGSVNAADSGEAASAVSTPQSYGLPGTIEEGAILHCWTWNFANIKANIPQIAEAGFKTIQTSPINAVWKGEGGKMKLKSTNNQGNWWYQYQPTDYVIGNYQLGTEEEFIEMCNEAHRYGIKVIVDIVANHCSSNESVISSHVKNIGGKVFHDRVEISDWSNRYQVTQGKLTGLMDLNTKNANVQNMILEYMNHVLEDGADGFRFDAAKHIELPDDDASYASNFWPTILDNNAEFQYGEILSGADRMGAYAEMMNVTAESYGTNLRTGLSKKSLSTAGIKNYKAYAEDMSSLDPSKLVTWVESHDNFCSDDNSSWNVLTDAQIRQGWAVICAQGDTTPLFFARPKGSKAYDANATTTQNFNNKWGDNTIGLAGNENYYTPEVVEVNKFRNAMVGESKNIVQVVRSKVNMIERGTKGAVLVSLSDDVTNVNVSTNLEAGEYTDRVSGETFTVANGKLTGKVGAGAVVVLYNDAEEVLVGDVNNNGEIDIDDATTLQRHLAKFTLAGGAPIIDETDPKQFMVADVDKDGDITILDVTVIQQMLANFI